MAIAGEANQPALVPRKQPFARKGAMTRKAEDKWKGKITRRRVLNVAAAGAGLAVGSGLVCGFPTIWAQNIKDVTLVHAGGSYAAIKEIGDQASTDLGFKIVMQAMTDDVQLNRSLTQPNSIDINNIDNTKIPYLVGKGVLAPVPVSKCKYWADTWNVAYVNPFASVITEEAVEKLPADVAKKAKAIGLYVLNGVLTVATIVLARMSLRALEQRRRPWLPASRREERREDSHLRFFDGLYQIRVAPQKHNRDTRTLGDRRFRDRFVLLQQQCKGFKGDSSFLF